MWSNASQPDLFMIWYYIRDHPNDQMDGQSIHPSIRQGTKNGRATEVALPLGLLTVTSQWDVVPAPLAN